MPGFRRFAHALGLGVLAFTSACLDDTPSPTAELSSSAALMLRAVADLGAAAERDIGIRVYYQRGSTQIDLPAEPSRVRVTSGEPRRQAERLRRRAHRWSRTAATTSASVDTSASASAIRKSSQ